MFHYLRRISGDQHDNNQAISYFRDIVDSVGTALTRFDAVLEWARFTFAAEKLQGYAVALNIIPRLAWLEHSITTQHRKLSSIGDVASKAAARYETSLEWLEQGRSIAWNQLLILHTAVNALGDGVNQAVLPYYCNTLL